MIGVVKFWNEQKGYGFIAREGAKDVFVHVSSVAGRDALEQGEVVEFDVVENAKGPEAKNVQAADA